MVQFKPHEILVVGLGVATSLNSPVDCIEDEQYIVPYFFPVDLKMYDDWNGPYQSGQAGVSQANVQWGHMRGLHHALSEGVITAQSWLGAEQRALGGLHVQVGEADWKGHKSS